MTFPVTGILDNFNRADEGPPMSANWTDVFYPASGAGGMVVFSNSAFVTAGSGASAWWSAATFGPDCEGYVTQNGGIDFGGVIIRAQSPGTTGIDGYYAQFYVTGQQLFLKRIDNNAETVLKTVNSFNPQAGDSIGISAVGDQIELWYKVGAGAWTLKETATDATYGGAGSIGLVNFQVGSPGTMDDFGGGTLVAGGQPSGKRISTVPFLGGSARQRNF